MLELWWRGDELRAGSYFELQFHDDKMGEPPREKLLRLGELCMCCTNINVAAASAANLSRICSITADGMGLLRRNGRSIYVVMYLSETQARIQTTRPRAIRI